MQNMHPYPPQGPRGTPMGGHQAKSFICEPILLKFSPRHSGLFQSKNGHFCFVLRHFWYFGNVRKLLFLTLFWPFLGIFKCFRPLQLKWLRRYGQKINLSLLQFLPFFIISFKKPKNWKINIFIFFAESPKVFELQRHTIPSL